MTGLRQRSLLAAAALTVLALLVGAGWVRARHLRQEQEEHYRRLIASGAVATARLVAGWLEERQRDAAAASEMVGIYGAAFLPDAAGEPPFPHRVEARQWVSAMLASLGRRERALAVWVLDPDGRVLAASDTAARPTLLERSAGVVADDLEHGTVLGPERLPGGALALSVSVPVHADEMEGGATRRIGTLVMRLDPERALFPLLQAGAIPPSSMQTILVARDAGSVVAISPLRRPRLPALGWRVARDSAPPLVRGALSGRDTVGTFDAVGGGRVLAATQPVRGSRWGLVRQVDEAEALAAYRRQLRWEALMLAGLAGLAALALFAASRARRAHRLAEVAESEARLAGIIGSAMDAIITVDDAERITLFNGAAERLFGCTAAEAIGRHVAELIPEPLHARHDMGLAAFRDGDAEMRVLAGPALRARRSDGREFPFEATLSRVRVGGRMLLTIIMRDITDRALLEEQLRQAQRLEAVGRLAGGIAHDFNNLLTAIGMHGELLLAALPPADPRRADVMEIRASVARAATLTQQLLAFSRRQVLQPRPIDLNEIVEGMEKMLRRVIGEDVQMATRLDPGVPPVLADPGRIEQVVMNLALNARDAMPRGGRLTIETSAATLAGPLPHALGLVPRGTYVALRVADTGTGMTGETLRHIFEPFFTTKPVGRGTGLGLATVYGIVEQSGGHIAVESTPGEGSAFTVYLPRAARPGAPVAPPTGFSLERARGAETILLAEDEDGVRTAVRRMLERQGYRVIAAADGEEALRLLAEAGPRVDLLLTDLVMPRLGGPELAARARATHPALPILAMTGYTDDEEAALHLAALGGALLQKPFTPEALATAVRRALDEGRVSGVVNRE